LTGDAGITSLHSALDFANSKGLNAQNLTWMQVPHHGSWKNISPSILNRLSAQTALFSASSKGESVYHPSKRVLNAFKRRGMQVSGTGSLHSHVRLCAGNTPPRTDEGPLKIADFYDTVEVEVADERN
jgi:beta-lactamase superfamily II metal-dependent hydrolase